MALFPLLLSLVRSLFAPRLELMAEILALRQQLAILNRTAKRPTLRFQDRLFWIALAGFWKDWRSALLIVKPETVIKWHRQLLGFEVAESTVAKYRIKSPKPSSQTWKTFLSNHAGDIIGIDFFTVPTATFRNLYCFIILLTM